MRTKEMFSKAVIITCSTALIMLARTSGSADVHQGSNDYSHCPEAAPYIYNHPARFELEPCGAWSVYGTVSFTYWQPIELGLTYAINNGNTTQVIQDAKTEGVSFSYEPGFELGLGWFYPHDNWESYLSYTYFRGSADGSTSGAAGTIIRGSWFAIANGDVLADSGSASWKISMNTIDFELARSMYLGSHLTMRPHFGLRTMWGSQDLNLSYTGTFDVYGTIESRNDSSSWGIGPRAGVKTNWHFGYGFSGVGVAGASILYSHYTVNHSEPDEDSIAAGNLFVINDQEAYTFRPNAEMAVGFEWGSYLGCDSYHLNFAAMYEFQVFWNQNAMREVFDFTSINGFGSLYDLFLHGLTVTGQLDF